ncbi:glutamyl-tRNA reductase [Chitiniphilus eburneus]|uniref:Glutamyl-tRNA reductase n=1 Tax=Chitiniphilus eburneus TaxID=2571148 RepID=A0A4U0QC59_9NEIS|nr:glutamyl-tRNA reductase [Chitiniphilus eburneus]TJZ78985.1 glutamyl-tRNA reductase [Chitiniphilus eburneus]
MNLVVLGINHETAPLAVRERLAFSQAELAPALSALAGAPGVAEAAIVSTCNRTELYVNAHEVDAVLEWFAASRGRNPLELAPHLYRLIDEDAARHAFRVAAGLDSMVLGETQILGQLKDAERVAREAGSLGVLLNGLFQRAFQVAKEVRSETRIGAASVSMAAAAVKLAERLYPSVSECSVLFIGAGEMIELCAAHFCAQHPRGMAVANRTLERGARLAEQYGGSAMLLSDLSERIAEFDIVVSCTAAPLAIVGKGTVERALKRRRHRPMFIVDLAVPRDVEPEVADLPDAYLYTVDDLAEVVRNGHAARQSEAEAAGLIIEAGVHEFRQWLAGRALVPTIRELKDHADRIARNELARARKRLAAGDDANDVLERLSEQLAAKLLHAPLATLNAAAPEEQESLLRTTRRIFRLHD